MSFFIFFTTFLPNYEDTSINIEKTYQKPIEGIIKIDNILEENLVKGKDNNYYLTHNTKGEPDKTGEIIIDYRNTITDNNIIIYGHNSKTIPVSFSILENYLDKSFYKKHKYITIDSNEYSYTYKIFSIMIIPNTNNIHTKIKHSSKDYKEYLNYLQRESIYNTNVKVTEEDIIVLQTCSNKYEDSFILINAVKEKTDEKTTNNHNTYLTF